MAEFFLRARRNSYFWIGLLGVMFLVVFVLIELRQALTDRPSLAWQVVTGLILLGALCYQWTLLVLRLFRFNSHMRLHYLAHRWVGVVAVLAFTIHAIRMGHTWTTTLAIVFFLTALSGLFNKEIISYNTRTKYLIWLGTHVTLSVIMLPLVLIHIWVALAYQ